MSEFTAPSIEELQSRFPNHKIESFIAQGGMGAVYLATQISLDRPVAIKILPKEFGEDLDYRVSFETEAKAMAKLNHSNLVGIYDFGDLDGMLYIIMEYIPGRSLFDTANGQQVDQIEAANLIVEMCHGLDHAHSAGMLHRDIKPANVLIDDEAQPKIVDFGLARPLGEEQNDGVVFGTPGYTAPEVISNPFAVDQRSDIFSMGVMLYEMLTGKLPDNPVIPASVLTHTDPRFNTILDKAINPNPDLRYSTAGDMAAALEDLIKNFYQSTGASATNNLLATGFSAGGSTPAMAKPVVLRSSKSNGSGLLVMLLLIAAAAGGYYVYDKSQKEEARLAAVELAEEREVARLKKEKEEKALALKKEKVAKEKAAAKKHQERLAEIELEKTRLEALAKQGRKAEAEARRAAKKREEERIEAERLAAANVKEKVYDHESFMAKERASISAKAVSILRDYSEQTEKIIDSNKRDILRAARRSLRNNQLERVEEGIEEYFTHWVEGDNRLNIGRLNNAKISEEFNEFLAEMTELEGDRDKKLIKHSINYAKKLEAKRGELAKENITASVEAIQAEIDALDSIEYFWAIVKSEDPSPDDY